MIRPLTPQEAELMENIRNGKVVYKAHRFDQDQMHGFQEIAHRLLQLRDDNLIKIGQLSELYHAEAKFVSSITVSGITSDGEVALQQAKQTV